MAEAIVFLFCVQIGRGILVLRLVLRCKLQIWKTVAEVLTRFQGVSGERLQFITSRLFEGQNTDFCYAAYLPARPKMGLIIMMSTPCGVDLSDYQKSLKYSECIATISQ